MKKNILSLFIFLTTASYLYAQSTPEEITNKFFNIYRTQSSKEAVDYLFSTNKFYKNNSPEVDSLKIKIIHADGVLGKLLSYELISTKTGGHSVLILTFVVNYEQEPLTFRFFLYKPESTWQLQTFKFDENIYDELEESSKTHNK